MTRTLTAVLLLLLVLGGSGAALAYHVTTDEAPAPAPEAAPTGVPGTTVPVTPAPPATPTPEPTPAQEIEPTRTPEAASVQQHQPTPEPVAPEASPTPEPLPTEPPQLPDPTRVSVPSIGVDAPVVGVALTDDGYMEAPAGYDEVGWYRLGAHPGETGKAVFAGHVDSRDGPAIFYHLDELVPGEVIEVTLGDGAEQLHYTVTETARYYEQDAPLDRIFGPSDTSELILITCAGDFDPNRRAYDMRLVVYATLVEEGS